MKVGVSKQPHNAVAVAISLLRRWRHACEMEVDFLYFISEAARHEVVLQQVHNYLIASQYQCGEAVSMIFFFVC